METSINLQQVRPEREAGTAAYFVGEGWLERVKGQLLHDRHVRGTITLGDDEARNICDWILENRRPYLYSFTDLGRFIGVELVEGEPARV
jgi:hypothetical protein